MGMQALGIKVVGVIGFGRAMKLMDHLKKRIPSSEWDSTLNNVTSSPKFFRSFFSTHAGDHITQSELTTLSKSVFA